AGIFILIGVLLLVVGGGIAGLLLWLRSQAQSLVEKPIHVDNVPPGIKSPLNPNNPPLTNAPVGELEVLVDSVPTQARILVGGKAIAEAPETIKVKKGETLEVTLHKEGYLDKSVTLDPAHDHKMIVRLERKPSEHDHDHSKPGKPSTPSHSPTVTPVVV